MSALKKNALKKREGWNSRLGVILAVAGSAVGLGNFLRFPSQAVGNGGGAFMIPYFLAFIFLGIPLMWIEWTVGRYAGRFGHGTAPGAFHRLWQNRWIKYIGIIGIFGPLVIYVYYTYIESWLLAYAFFSATKSYFGLTTAGALGGFLQNYQGLTPGSTLWAAYVFFLLTFLANIYVLRRGVSGGIEKLARLGMPLLLVVAVVLLARIFTLGAPDPAQPDWSIWNGLGFLWNPDFPRLLDASVWLAAAGQIFFSLSIGIGVILSYASYLKPKDDVVLSGLTSASVNEFFEVIFGGSLVIPAAFAFFGPLAITSVVKSGMFNLSFVTMPLIFQQIPLGSVFATLWFILLFVAGITSSVSVALPLISFLEDEFHCSKARAVRIFGWVAFVLCQPMIFFLGHGVLDEVDFWGGTFFLTVFGLIETVLFVWVFGLDKAWDEMHRGAHIGIPRIYRFIIKYITPTALLLIVGSWFWQQAVPVFLMRNIPVADRPYILAARLGMILVFAALAALVRIAWKHKKPGGGK
ncbi:MAG: sodium-dependent transporter [Candidatus Margulisbacteria bacterium]|jgi:SNF family Na+-dependent transporter|nr:sodium-dependent transporter [Candidatus Margulisiibacteriota bacterium]